MVSNISNINRMACDEGCCDNTKDSCPVDNSCDHGSCDHRSVCDRVGVGEEEIGERGTDVDNEPK